MRKLISHSANTLLTLMAITTCYASESHDTGMELPPITKIQFQNTKYDVMVDNGIEHLSDPSGMSAYTLLSAGQGVAITIDFSYATNSVNLTGSGRHAFRSIVSAAKLLGNKVSLEIAPVIEKSKKSNQTEKLAERRITHLVNTLRNDLGGSRNIISNNSPVVVNKFKIAQSASSSADTLRIQIKNTVVH